MLISHIHHIQASQVDAEHKVIVVLDTCTLLKQVNATTAANFQIGPIVAAHIKCVVTLIVTPTAVAELIGKPKPENWRQGFSCRLPY